MDFPDIILGNGKDYFDNMNPVQAEFHADESEFRWMGGAVCAGKSIAGCVEGWWHSWIFPGNVGWVLRETYDEIRSSVLKDMREVIPRWLIFNFNKNEWLMEVINHQGYDFWVENRKKLKKHVLRDELEELNGLSEIWFKSFESTMHGEQKLKSAHIGWFFVDQAEESTEGLHKELQRRKRHQPSALRGWYASNPNGHDWLWRYFSDESPHKMPGYKAFDIETEQNKVNLVPNYLESIRATHTDEEYEQQVHGSFEIATGAIFTEFSPSIHVVKHIEPPDDWVKGVGLDPGLNNPTGIMLAARMPTGDLYWYWEWQEKEHLVSSECEVLRNILTPQHRFRVIDRDATKRNKATGLSLLDEYNRHGQTFMPSDADVTAGLNRMKEYMAFDPEKQNPFTGRKGSPRWFVSDRCMMFIEQLLAYRKAELATQRGKKNVPEKPHKWNDHLIDASRYLTVKITYPLTVASAGAADDLQNVYGPLPPRVDPQYMDEENQVQLDRVLTDLRQEPRVEGTTWLEV